MAAAEINQKSSTGRVLRPLLWWLLLVLVLLAIRTHQRLLAQTRLYFSISLKGQPLPYPVLITWDGRPISSGERISLGTHQFAIEGPKTDSFSTNLSVWYGRYDFGEIRLRRCMGTLSVKADPPAQSITISGPEFSTTLEDCSGTNLFVPTDTYSVSAQYRHWSDSRMATIAENSTSPVSFAPKFGAVQLGTVPSGAYVHTIEGNYLGTTPLLLPEMVPQTTQFMVSLSGYMPVQVTLYIAADQTNSWVTNLVNISNELSIQSPPTALSSKPGDADTLAIQAEASKNREAQRQRFEQEQRNRERMERPKKSFDQLCSEYSAAPLFAEHELDTTKSASEVATAIVTALTNSPNAFKIVKTTTLDANTYAIVAQQTGFLDATERDCLIVIGSPHDGQTQIRFKVLEFEIQHHLTGDKQLIPLSQSKMQGNSLLLLHVKEGLQILIASKIHKTIGK